MKNIEISVVVPLFNEEEVIRETSRKLADALGQFGASKCKFSHFLSNRWVVEK
jgi:glycosyltransferase involved in cell wall biosynthesis